MKSTPSPRTTVAAGCFSYCFAIQPLHLLWYQFVIGLLIVSILGYFFGKLLNEIQSIVINFSERP